jgi:palmitoyltransferase
MSGAQEEGEMDMVSNHGHGHGHGHGHHRHGHGCCKGLTAPLMKILGLDRFTKGKAVSGMRRAGQDQNPFDLGVVAVSFSSAMECVSTVHRAFGLAKTL